MEELKYLKKINNFNLSRKIYVLHILMN